jgi:Flp pilus assembly protein TadG
MKDDQKTWECARRIAAQFVQDRSAIAATEFAVIAPLMLVLFFGVIEVTDGIAAYRDVSIMAHTISDLTSQSTAVEDSDLSNFFSAATGIMYPFVTSVTDPNLKQSIVELWVNPSLQARVQWAENSDGSTPLAPGTVVTIPSSLQVANTYVIYSSVSYLYLPTGGIGYVVSKAGITLHDFAYTRPRQSQCVFYDPPTPPPTTCPQS